MFLLLLLFSIVNITANYFYRHENWRSFNTLQVTGHSKAVSIHIDVVTEFYIGKKLPKIFPSSHSTIGCKSLLYGLQLISAYNNSHNHYQCFFLLILFCVLNEIFWAEHISVLYKLLLVIRFGSSGSRHFISMEKGQ